MNISFEKIYRKSKYYEQTKNIFHEAFPKDKWIPLWWLTLKSKKHNIDFFAILDEENFIGMTYIITYNNLSFILYFAIIDRYRGQGYGSIVLDIIKEKYKNNRIVLNIEEIDKKSENYNQRLKRKKFYEKNGFTFSHLKTKEKSIIYENLSYGGSVTKDEMENLMINFVGKLLFWILDLKYKEV